MKVHKSQTEQNLSSQEIKRSMTMYEEVRLEKCKIQA